jgi:hypothetical protein
MVPTLIYNAVVFGSFIGGACTYGFVREAGGGCFLAIVAGTLWPMFWAVALLFAIARRAAALGSRLAKYAGTASLLALICSPAQASNCGQFFQRSYATTYYAAPAVYAAPQVYYQAGRDIEADALAEKVAKLVAVKLQAQASQRGPVARGQNAAAAGDRPVGPAIFTHCAKCHSGGSPAGGIAYDGMTKLACSQVTKALRAIADDSMPKDHKIDAAVKGQLMQELLDLEAAPAAAGVER